MGGEADGGGGAGGSVGAGGAEADGAGGGADAEGAGGGGVSDALGGGAVGGSSDEADAEGAELTGGVSEFSVRPASAQHGHVASNASAAGAYRATRRPGVRSRRLDSPSMI